MPDFHYLTTHVGSVPHPNTGDLPARLASLLDIPAWTQHPKRSFRESMYVQFASSLPAVIENEENERIIVDTRSDLTSALEVFYSAYLADELEAFSLQPSYASGFFAMMDALKSTVGTWAKGQVTGPVSFGLTVTDQDLRAILYNDLLADVIVKNVAMIARWQARQLKAMRPNAIIFLDEPYMSSFGSAFISLSREQVITFLDEVIEGIHSEGALAGVHCCGNTDWSVLLATNIDILNLDAYGYIENLALYPAELRAFLDRGGATCWGIVPNNEHIFIETAQGLADRLQNGIAMICQKAAGRGVHIQRDDFARSSLLAPACGLGPVSVEIAERAFDVLTETGRILQKG